MYMPMTFRTKFVISMVLLKPKLRAILNEIKSVRELAIYKEISFALDVWRYINL